MKHTHHFTRRGQERHWIPILELRLVLVLPHPIPTRHHVHVVRRHSLLRGRVNGGRSLCLGYVGEWRNGTGSHTRTIKRWEHD